MTSPIFLLCSERSGSNLIRAMMDAHSQVYAPMPLHFGRNYWLTIHQYGDLSKAEAWHLLIKHVMVSFKTWMADIGIELSEEELLANVPVGNFKDVYSYIYEKGMRESGKTRIFIKENHTQHQLYFLIRYFPNAKFVLQVRDPRDYLLSCKKAGMHYGTLVNARKMWEHDQSRALEALYVLTPSQVFVQRYEDLIEDPEKVLRALCQFLDLPFDPAMLSFHETAAANKAAETSHFWQNLNRPVLSENRGKYRNGLSPWEVRMIEYRLGPLMRRFGYEPENGEITRLTERLTRLYEWGVSGGVSFLAKRQKVRSDKEAGRIAQFSQARRDMKAEVGTFSTRVVYPYQTLAPQDTHSLDRN